MQQRRNTFSRLIGSGRTIAAKILVSAPGNEDRAYMPGLRNLAGIKSVIRLYNQFKIQKRAPFQGHLSLNQLYLSL
jgi:hypothetical protein